MPSAERLTPCAEPTLGPVDEAARLSSLDVLRGFAVLGILVMNIQAFSMIAAAYVNPTAYGDLTGANYWVWVLSHVLADQKFISIFSMLFGAGIVLMTRKAEARGGDVARLHRRRMGWLIIFGLLHAHLLWYGDILFMYGVTGLVVYRFRNKPLRRLIAIGVVFLAVASALWIGVALSVPLWPPEAVIELAREGWQPPPEIIETQLAAYRGGFLDQMRLRPEEAFFMEALLFPLLFFWKTAGLMLIGMALFELGVFSAKRSRRLYLGFIVVAVFIGIPAIAYGVHRNVAAAWDVRYSFFFGPQYNYWASVIVALGWVGLVMLACQSQRLVPLTRPLAAVGRTALSNYLLQTVICTTIFYGHGLGLFGSVERVGQLAIVIGVWVMQLIASPLWLRYFAFGPMEWLWRSLTYRTPQPMRRSAVLASA